MKDRDKSKEQLISELIELRRQVAEFKTIELKHKHTVNVLVQHNRELTFLIEAIQTFISTLHLGRVLDAILEGVRQCLSVVACSAWLIDRETNELVCRQAVGPGSELALGWRLAPGEGLAGWVFQTGEHVIVPDTRADKRHFKGVNQQIGVELRSIISVPLRLKEEVIGALHVLDTEVDRFGKTDLLLLESLAAIATIAIENAQLYEQAQQEIIERERTESALRKSEERFRQVIDSVSAHIYVTEVTEEGRYINLYLSPDVETLTGYPHKKFMTDRDFWPSRVIHPEDRETAAAHAAQLTVGQDGEIEYRLIQADGEIIWVRDSARVEGNGSSKMIYGVVSDITERKQLEEQLYQSQKMKAIGVLAGGMAHNFNNLMTVIAGYSELIYNQIGDDASLRQDVEQIKKAGNQATSLIGQLMAFSRQEVLRPKVIDLNDIVSDMDRLLRPIIDENIDLIIEPDVMLDQVKADPGRMQQVIMNLVINAGDAMPGGGKLTIKTAMVNLDQAYVQRHVGIAPGGYVMLAVSDTGYGMDEATQSRIFEPFFTTKEEGQGTGLGLATVHGIITQSGGHIEVDSEPGRGTTFKVYLPSADIKPVNRHPIAI